MRRIVRNVGEVGAVKSKEITVPPDRYGAHTNGAYGVDLHGTGKANGKRVLPVIGCPETNGLVFPIECLQGPVRAITEEVSRQERNPCGLAAACVLGTVSAAIGKGLKIHSLVNKTCPANVYILVGTPSGQGKSETMRQIIKPLRLYEDERIQDWEHNVKGNLEAQERRFKSQIKGMERRLSSPTFKGNPQAVQEQLETAIRSLGTISKRLLAPPRLILENATSEATAKLLGANAECLASVSPDARELINILCGRYTDGNTDEAVFIKTFSWDPYNSNRITRDPVGLQEPCLTCLWLVQPDKIAEVFSCPSLTTGGLLPRFMLLMADYEPQPIDRSIPGLSRETEAEWDTFIRDLLETYRSVRPESVVNCQIGRQEWAEVGVFRSMFRSNRCYFPGLSSVLQRF